LRKLKKSFLEPTYIEMEVKWPIDKKEFLIQHLTEDRSYQDISDDYSIPRPQLSQWWEDGLELRAEIKRANQLFNNRKGTDEFIGFEKLGKRNFYEWFKNQPKNCAYCGIEESKLQELFNADTPTLKTKRGRGKVLELERRDTDSNEYSPKNCVLACYICNNHKSDLISETDHLKYFAPAIKEYLDTKHSKINDNR
jgi:5-methylcytosine-specific restriction endonuclease McrA